MTIVPVYQQLYIYILLEKSLSRSECSAFQIFWESISKYIMHVIQIYFQVLCKNELRFYSFWNYSLALNNRLWNLSIIAIEDWIGVDK